MELLAFGSHKFAISLTCMRVVVLLCKQIGGVVFGGKKLSLFVCTIKIKNSKIFITYNLFSVLRKASAKVKV